jgi:hypothetical protein
VDNLIVMTRPAGPSRGRAPDSGTADILFFTGVRYYREHEAPVAPDVAARRRSNKAKKAAELRRLERQA